MRRCIYCKVQVPDSSLMDFCERCGRAAFGDRLFETIKDNMTMANERGDLQQSK